MDNKLVKSTKPYNNNIVLFLFNVQVYLRYFSSYVLLFLNRVLLDYPQISFDEYVEKSEALSNFIQYLV